MSEPARYLGLSDFAARVGLTPGTVDGYRRKGYLPEPDAVITSGETVTRGWLPETVDAWMASRPGRGARTDLRK